MKKFNIFKKLSIGVIWIWFGMFAIIPIALTFFTSFLKSNNIMQLTLHNYMRLFNSAYLRIMLQSLNLATLSTFICLLLGYPFAYIIAQTKSKYKSILLLLVIIPFWTSSLIRTYAIISIIKARGLLNSLLIALHIIQKPLPILYSYTGVLIGCVYDLLPFMILPLYVSISKLNMVYVEAARDLGANKTTTFLKIILPLTMPGILSGSFLVFLPAITMFYIPSLLGGAKNLLIGNLIEHQFLTANNQPMGSAICIFITLILGLFIAIYWYNLTTKEKQTFA